MIKILIVEDKPPILWSIRQMIESCGLEIKVVGEAFNGEEALSLINTYNPDVVFTDIKMPVMDGLKLINEVKKNHPDIFFIIISGYDEFEYARQAMKLGVTEYLLKPVTEEAINEVLGKVVASVNNNVSQNERKILQDILNLGNNRSATISYEFGCQYYYTLVVCAGPYSNHIIDYANPFNYYWTNINLTETVSRHLPEKAFFWCFEGKSLNEAVLLLGFQESMKIMIEKLADSIWKDLCAYNIPVTIAVSKKIKNVSDIGSETHSTRTLLRRNILFGKSNMVINGKISNRQDIMDIVLDSSIEKTLTTYIQGQQKDLFYSEIKKMLTACESKCSKQHSIERLLKQVVRTCCKAYIDKPGLSMELDMEIEEAALISKDYPSLLKALDSIFTHFFTTKRSNNKSETTYETIERLENYLKQHLADQITLNSLAEMAGLDPSYLSRVFKKSKGVAPMDYLTNLKIEKAKELISSSSELMLKEVAEIVGYNSPYYFSRIFKAVTGLTPSEYKNTE